MNICKRVFCVATAVMLALFVPLPQTLKAPPALQTQIRAQAASSVFPTVTGKWKKTDKGMTFVQKSGVPVRGAMVTIKGKVYSFSASGYMQTGWTSLNGSWYYMNRKGEACRGWARIRKKWYYFDTRTYAMRTGWLVLSRTRVFYLGSKGVMLTGPQTIGGKPYIFAADGVLKDGQVKIGNRTYGRKSLSDQKADKEGGKWRRVGSKWAYMQKDGTFAKDVRLTILGKDYLFDKKGYMVVGWKKVNGKWYYANPGGDLVVNGWKKIDHEEYYFYQDGSMAVNTKIGKAKITASGAKYRKRPVPEDSIDEKAQGYESSTEYLILVNKSRHEVGIYKGEKGYWFNIRKFDCGDGKPSTPTIEGSFEVGIKMRYFDSGSARCWYATQFCGNFLFHSVLYYQSYAPTYVMDGRVGTGVSHGCVRCRLDDCQWIYNNIPRGTRVIVYRE